MAAFSTFLVQPLILDGISGSEMAACLRGIKVRLQYIPDISRKILYVWVGSFFLLQWPLILAITKREFSAIGHPVRWKFHSNSECSAQNTRKTVGRLMTVDFREKEAYSFDARETADSHSE